jgi:alkylation response protein AidB-like acyl-CoA dehydrogenase
VGISKRELARLKRIASRETRHGKPLLSDPLFSAKLARLEAELMALEITNLRVLAAEAEKRSPGPEVSILSHFNAIGSMQAGKHKHLSRPGPFLWGLLI